MDTTRFEMAGETIDRMSINEVYAADCNIVPNDTVRIGFLRSGLINFQKQIWH
jgi:hypothetical protein